MPKFQTIVLALVVAGAAAAGYLVSRTVHSPDPAENAAWVFEVPLTQIAPTAGDPATLGTVRQPLTVINFWATWCPPCVEEMPDLARVYADVKDRGVVVIGLAVDNPRAVAAFPLTQEVGYPIFVAGAAGQALGERLGNPSGALPYTVLIGADGSVQRQKLGKISEDELRSWLNTSK